MKRLFASALCAVAVSFAAAPSWAGSGFSFGYYESDHDGYSHGRHGRHGYHSHRHHDHCDRDYGYYRSYNRYPRNYVSYSYYQPAPVYVAPAPAYYVPAPAPVQYSQPSAYNRLVLGWR